MSRRLGGCYAVLCLLIAGGFAQALRADSARADSAVTPAAVVAHYADIAKAGYEDSLTAAKDLKSAIEALIADPTDASLTAARDAWVAAREPYMQTEAYRFGNRIVDDWEGRVNAWPLDEGLIDYVADSYGDENPDNAFFRANVIAQESLKIGGKLIDTSKITPALLQDALQEAGGIEANVATGYHAIEFLLWGQDLNGTDAGAGARPHTDFDTTACTGGNCDRRAAYLKAATDLLLKDLEWIIAAWGPEGPARKAVSADPTTGVRMIFTGLGSLSYGELAGERMKLGLLLHDPEEEHDCFSDNSHRSHYGNALGIQNIYLGTYKRLDGTTLSGPSVSDLVAEKSAEIDTGLRDALAITMEKMSDIDSRAKTVEAYDQMIGQGNAEGNAVVQAAIDALVAQTKEIERAIAVLKLGAISIEGSDSLDNPGSVR